MKGVHTQAGHAQRRHTKQHLVLGGAGQQLYTLASKLRLMADRHRRPMVAQTAEHHSISCTSSWAPTPSGRQAQMPPLA